MGWGEPETLTRSTPVDKFKGILFSLTMLCSAFFGCIYIMLPIVPLIFLYPRLYRRLVDRLVGFWLTMPSYLMELLFGLNVTVTGDDMDHSKPALIIMNHRTRLDWLYFWSALVRVNPWLLISEKISLKGILKFVPGAGWAMASNTFMFLDRDFEQDKTRISQLIEYYARVGDNYQLLLYPEGTDKCPRATARSKLYAERKGLPHYEYVLHPRTTGFVFMIQKMRKENYIDYIYDVTVAFNDAIVQSEADLIKLGLTSKDVRFDIRKIPISELPESDEALSQWLKEHWIKKEERLKQFYHQARETRKLDTLPRAKTFDATTVVRFIQISISTVWIILTFTWIYFFVTSNYRLILGSATIFFYVGAQKFYDGAEMLISKIGLDEWHHTLARSQGLNGDMSNGHPKIE